MKSICFFNNKGGVGKTTLTCNLAYIFSKEFGKRVAIVDCDPQCNATLLVLGEEKTLPLYWKEDNDSSGTQKTAQTEQTLSNILQPLEYGDSNLNLDFNLISHTTNRFSVDLIPGHPRISILEEKLSQAWRDTTAGDIEGLRRTNWVTQLNNKLSTDYDIVFYDLGPSLGSLNRSCLIGTDYFMTPMGADIFSMIGLKNISEWMDDWLLAYTRAITICDQRFPNAIEKFDILRKLNVINGYVGYTILSYIAKYRQGEKRLTQAFETIIANFPEEVKNSVEKYSNRSTSLWLGDIPNMFSLVPLAQSNSSPIGALTARDGLVGAHFAGAKKNNEILVGIAQKIAQNIDL